MTGGTRRRIKVSRRNLISALRSWLYWWAKLLGDVSAVSKGPRAIEKRLMRRAAGRMTSRLLWRWFR
jgi:hypothetical protein